VIRLRKKGVAMSTAIIGTGNIGSAVARHLVAGGESVVVAARDESQAKALADELGPNARAASVENAISGADAVELALWLDDLTLAGRGIYSRPKLVALDNL